MTPSAPRNKRKSNSLLYLWPQIKNDLDIKKAAELLTESIVNFKNNIVSKEDVDHANHVYRSLVEKKREVYARRNSHQARQV